MEEDFAAFHKPPGIHTHPSEFSRREPSFLELAEEALGENLFTIHRLDRAASGLLLFARTTEAAAYLGRLFREHKIQKIYYILARGWLKEQTSEKPLSYSGRVEPRASLTRFFPERYYRLPLPFLPYPEIRLTWCRVEPETGRRHQIRLHAKSLRHPVVGDVKHGDTKLNHFMQEHLGTRRLWLVCTELRFVHPFDGRERVLTCGLEDDMSRGLDGLEGWVCSPPELEKT